MNPKAALLFIFATVVRCFAVPTVDVFVNGPGVGEGGIVEFLFHKTGSGVATVPFTFGGDAVEGKDFVTGTGAHSLMIPDNVTNLNLLVYALYDRATNTEPTLVLHLEPDPSYTIGDANLAGIQLLERNPFFLNLPPGVFLSTTQWSDHVDIQVRAFDPDGITSIWLYDNYQLLTLTNAAPLNFSWTNPPAGRHELSAIAMDKRGAAAGLSNKPPTILIVGDGFAFPKEGASSTNGLTLTADLVTSYDTRDRHRRLLLEFPIPASATNSEGLLEFTATARPFSIGLGPRTNEIFAYSGDGLLSTNDLFVAGEPVTRFVTPVGTNAFRLDISPVIRSHAGGYLGLWIDDAPDQNTIAALGQIAARYSDFKLEIFDDSTDEPTTARLLSPPRDSSVSFFEPPEVTLQIVDNDSRVISIELRSAQTGLIGKYDGLLLLGTNIVTLQWTNPVPGDHRLFLNTSNEDGISTTIELGQIHVDAIEAKVIIPTPADVTRPAETPHRIEAIALTPSGGEFAAELSVDGGAVVDRRSFGLTAGTNMISLTWTNPTAGDHTFEIRLTDNAGNSTIAKSAKNTFIFLNHEWLYSGDNVDSMHVVDAAGRGACGDLIFPVCWDLVSCRTATASSKRPRCCSRQRGKSGSKSVRVDLNPQE